MPASFSWTRANPGKRAALPKHWLMSDFHSFCAPFCQPDEPFEGSLERPKPSPWRGCYLYPRHLHPHFSAFGSPTPLPTRFTSPPPPTPTYCRPPTPSPPPSP